MTTENPFYRDDTMLEHRCCWDAAIVRKCEPGKGQYSGDVALVCECREEYVNVILKVLNHDR